MRQFAAEISFAQFTRQFLGIDTAAGADLVSLTCGNGSNTRSADTRLYSALFKLSLNLIDVIHIDKRYFDTLT